MKAVFCDICKNPTNRWYVVEIRADASKSNINVGDMFSNSGTYEVCCSCLNKIKKGIIENADKN